MDNQQWLAQEFGAYKSHLRKVAFRILGSASEADDALQESWLRVSRAGTDGVENLGGWLTTIVSRVCLDMLRARKSRREAPLEALADRAVAIEGVGTDPEQDVLLSDSVGLALLIVLQMLTPAERVAYVLHDMFDLSFDDIAPIVGRTAQAARQLASRGRRRLRGAEPGPQGRPATRRQIVEAFLSASRKGDFEALLALLDPDVVLRTDQAPLSGDGVREIRGAATVANGARLAASRAAASRLVLVNGSIGLAWFSNGEPVAVLAFSIKRGKIAEIDVIGASDRLRAVRLTEVEAH